jgi:hypothetical protein
MPATPVAPTGTPGQAAVARERVLRVHHHIGARGETRDFKVRGPGRPPLLCPPRLADLPPG